MTRHELLERLTPILTLINSSAVDVDSLMTSPSLDEDYKVARARQISTENLDRLQLAADTLSTAVDALQVSPNPDSRIGVAGDCCYPGNECGRLGCPECQQ